MLPVRTPALLIAFASLLAGPVYAQSLDDAIASARAAVAEYVATSPAPGVSVAVWLDDSLVWAEGFGLADVEQGVPVTEKTLFRAWSISKPLTAAAVGLLYERGQLDLDAPITTYVPSFPDKGSPITIRQLGGHRAGIPHYGPGDLANFHDYESVLEALDKFKTRPLLFEPGEGFEYSSFGYNLIGAVVESVARKPYLEFMETEVFAPLGMTRTRPDRYREIIPERTRFYETSESGELSHAPFTDNSDLWPSGGFLSTPTDLVTFGGALLQGGLLEPETVQLLFTPMGPAGMPGIEYGLGWYVRGPMTPEGGRVLMHPGGHYGGASLLSVWEQRQMVVAIMANTTMTNSVFGEILDLQTQIEGAFMAVPRPDDSGP